MQADPNDECPHLLTYSTCAYCTGSYRRELRQLEAEQRQLLRAIARKREREFRGG